MNDIHIGLISGRHDSMRTNEGGEMDAYVWHGKLDPKDRLSQPGYIDKDALFWLNTFWEQLDLGNELKKVRLYLTGCNHAYVGFYNGWQVACRLKNRTPQGLIAMHYNPKTGDYDEHPVYFNPNPKSNNQMVKSLPLTKDPNAHEADWIQAKHPELAQAAIMEYWFRMTGTYTFAQGSRVLEV